MSEEQLQEILRRSGYSALAPAKAKKPKPAEDSCVGEQKTIASVAQPLRPQSKLEARFEQQLQAKSVRPWVRDYFFCPGRDWELDFAWPELKIYVSIEGQAHRVKARFKADTEKHAKALLLGWVGLRVCGDDVRNERAIQWLLELGDKRLSGR